MTKKQTNKQNNTERRDAENRKCSYSIDLMFKISIHKLKYL